MDKRVTPKTERHLYKQDNFDYERFGQKVKIERMICALRQEDLAQELGCVRSTVSKCERGMAVDPRIMIAICIRFKLNILDYCNYENISD